MEVGGKGGDTLAATANLAAFIALLPWPVSQQSLPAYK